MESNAKYRSASDDYNADEDFISQYKRLLGSLLYISQNSKPDILYSTDFLGRFQMNPTDEHFTALKRIFRYLFGTRNYCLEYSIQNEAVLTGFVDASWGDDLDGRKSTTGYCYL